MAEVVDLLDSDEEELALPLAARLAAAGKREGPARPQGSQERAPLAAVHNQKDSSAAAAAAAAATVAAGGRPYSPTSRPTLAATASLGGADLLRQRQAERAARKAARAAAAAGGGGLPGPLAPLGEAAADAELRAQYHQQEQRLEEQRYEAALGSGSQQAARRGPTRGVGSGSALRKQQAAAWEPPFGSEDASLEPYSQQRSQLSPLAADGEDWQPPASSQGAARRGGAAAAAAAAGAGQPPAKKGRRPKRTAEEIARDKAIQAREREVRKQLKQATTKKHAVQQVRLLVDASLVSSSGSKGGSLGIGMLNHLDEYNRKLSAAAAEEKRINYAVAALDLAPFKALRWQRRLVLGAAAQGAPASQQPDSQASFAAAAAAGVEAGTVVAEEWEQEPHVMVCFQEFIDAVRRDRLASLFSLLERRAAGQRPYLLVCGLARHIEAQERKQHRSDMRAGAMAPVQQSVKPVIDEFLAGLHVECPTLSFRDVVDEAQAAQHVQLITAAIAQGHHRDSEATVYLRAHSKGDSAAMTNMLVNNELDASLEPFAKSIFAVPLVQPGIAHALAGYYGSLGGLMDMLLDPSRSDADKEGELKQMERTHKLGGKSGMRVGPAAARQLLQLLRSGDPNLRISSSSKESDE